MQFTDFPATFQPTVQSIDTWFHQPENWHVVRSQGTERQIDNDQHGHHLSTGETNRCPTNAQGNPGLYEFDAFRPTEKISPELIQALFTKVAGDVKILYERFTGRAQTEN